MITLRNLICKRWKYRNLCANSVVLLYVHKVVYPHHSLPHLLQWLVGHVDCTRMDEHDHSSVGGDRQGEGLEG